MSLVGATRVLEVYPLWFVVFGVAILLMLRFRIRVPKLIFWLVILCLLKDVGVDYLMAGVQRPRVYWAEHAPLLLWIVALGVGGMMGVDDLRGYVGRLTMVLAGIALLFDVWKDLTESATVYGR